MMDQEKLDKIENWLKRPMMRINPYIAPPFDNPTTEAMIWAEGAQAAIDAMSELIENDE